MKSYHFSFLFRVKNLKLPVIFFEFSQKNVFLRNFLEKKLVFCQHI